MGRFRSHEGSMGSQERSKWSQSRFRRIHGVRITVSRCSRVYQQVSGNLGFRGATGGHKPALGCLRRVSGGLRGVYEF